MHLRAQRSNNTSNEVLMGMITFTIVPTPKPIYIYGSAKRPKDCKDANLLQATDRGFDHHSNPRWVLNKNAASFCGIFGLKTVRERRGSTPHLLLMVCPQNRLSTCGQILV